MADDFVSKIDELCTLEEFKDLYYNQGLSTYKLAEKFGINAKTVCRYMQMHNLPVKDRKQDILRPNI